MPKDALLKNDAPAEEPDAGSSAWVSEIQAKLHRWATADPDCRFDDLFNLVHAPATLRAAWRRVIANKGASTPGSDGLTAASITEGVGAAVFLNELRCSVKSGQYRPQPVRERKIPKPGGSGKLRKLGIPTIADRVVQAALKIVLEPIFEADFIPVSYGFRPARRAHDAIAEIHYFGSRGYRMVLDADIEACFDNIDHVALMNRMRRRVGDKRVLALVKAFLKAGLLTELGDFEDTHTGTPQGGILSPLLANVALSALDEHVHAPWQPSGSMSTQMRRRRRRWKGLANWRIIRYADDFVVLVHGSHHDVEALRQEITDLLAPIGLRLSPAKTRIVDMSEGFDFLGFHIQWKKKKGAQKWHVYTFAADRTVRSVKAKIRALTRKASQQPLSDVLIRINQITRGWANYFRHGVVSRTFDHLHQFTWWRLVTMMRARHRWTWKDVRRWLTVPSGRWLPIRDGDIELFNPTTIPIRRYRYRGNTIPNPWIPAA